MIRLVSTALLIPTFAAAAQSPVPAVWTIDRAHSSVSFQIRHFVSKVRGSFTDFSTRIVRTGDDAKIHGQLTMRGITRDVVLDGHFNGIQKSSQGGDRVGFDATLTLDRL